MMTSAEHYSHLIAMRMMGQRTVLAARWLVRLNDVPPIGAHDGCPSDQLLDHIRALISEIATSLRAPGEATVANAAVIDQARELGLLRHRQRASVHQVLREYEILAEILEEFVTKEAATIDPAPSTAESVEVFKRLTGATWILTRTTVDTFVSEYAAAIEARNERIEAFDRMASHELRTPLGVIVFAAAALGNDAIRSDPARVAKVVQTIRTNADRMSWLLSTVERLARLSEPVDGPSRQAIELQTVAADVARQLDEIARARRVTIRVRPGLPCLFGDLARVELILINLVSNAIKYSDPEKRESFVEVGSTSRSADDGCEMYVRDNGIGIPDSQKDAVFERFFRAHSHRDHKLGVTGVGLGLAIVKDCVEALAGHIRVESHAGEGTSFYVTLPRTNLVADPKYA